MTASALARKLGIKPGMRVLAKNAPSHFSSLLGSVPQGVRLLKTSTDKVDCVIVFVRCKADVQAVARAALDAVIEDGLLWFAYPKKSGSIKTDISRDHGWEPVFDADFDSVAQISIDPTWTGFRFRAKHLVKKSTK